jgi:hypothetical protein
VLVLFKNLGFLSSLLSKFFAQIFLVGFYARRADILMGFFPLVLFDKTRERESFFLLKFFCAIKA